MIYNVIGLMSGSSLDGLDIAFVEFQEKAGKWNYEIIKAACKEYDIEWQAKLRDAIELSARDYQLLHTEYGKYLGEKVNEFIEDHQLHHQVNLIASHGHTTFHLPEKRMTHQLGEGAAIAAETRLPVVTDLRAMDVAFGGQGAPIVPLGEKLLFPDHHFFLMERLSTYLATINFEIHIPGREVVKYKEALIMALLGILRWREQYTVLASVTGATQNSIAVSYTHLTLPTNREV